MGIPRDQLPPHVRRLVEDAEAKNPRRKKSPKKPKPPPREIDPIFLVLLRRYRLPEPVGEYEFDRCGREWRFDICWPDHKVAVEVDGGIEGRMPSHSSPANIRRDQSKGNAAQLQGWTFLRFEPADLRKIETIDQIAEALGI